MKNSVGIRFTSYRVYVYVLQSMCIDIGCVCGKHLCVHAYKYKLMCVTREVWVYMCSSV